ncbi:unnamed protein product [Zymoseptoria tritici ST99CH_1A5]|uniref:C2H2-type domain-containing protein n=1 Tax=Zymoseptoria tritici ST99CH_1A5 TaxID=1276529 RepID=A0A1Y6L759_ZYMTR|nr:unnamed protein product [Zymoseptoria tritici ST99CH_1A5]
MSRFQESALRNSAADEAAAAAAAAASSLPYWHPSSQFSSLIDPQHDPAMSLSDGHGQAAALGYDFSNNQLPGQQQTNMTFDVAQDQRYMDFTGMNGFPQQQQQQQQQMQQQQQQPLPDMSQYGPMSKVKTPTGTKSMRRPGLAGASALMNGQYCCHWTAQGVACRHKFLDAKQLNDHIKAYHVRGAGNFLCHWAGCDKGNFPTANKLVRHVHSHTGYKPFPCSSCSQAFVTKDQLEKHLTTHTGAKDFVCTWPGCDRSFAVKHALDGHMNSVHLKAKKHTCPHCGQAFDDSSNLSKHKKQVHNPETGIKCPARHTHGCMYVDSRKDKLKEHCEHEHHGLETIHDPHAWNLWVLQFKSASRNHATIYTVVTLPYRPATKRTATLVCLVMSIMPSTPLSRLVTKGLATRAMTMIATLLTLPSHPVTKMTVIPAKISTARCQQDSRATYPQRAQYRTAPALQGRLPIRQRPMAR